MTRRKRNSPNEELRVETDEQNENDGDRTSLRKCVKQVGGATHKAKEERGSHLPDEIPSGAQSWPVVRYPE